MDICNSIVPKYSLSLSIFWVYPINNFYIHDTHALTNTPTIPFLISNTAHLSKPSHSDIFGEFVNNSHRNDLFFAFPVLLTG